MLAIRHSSYGDPHAVIEAVDVPEPGPPGPGQALVSVEASTINPSDLLRLQGAYGDSAGDLPADAGSQGVGRVLEVGAGVKHLKPGDLVPLHVYFAGAGIWRERLLHPASELIALPEADRLQLAMINGNPPSAWLMLQDYVSLKPGDWVIQNAANSSVGHYVIQLAHALGLQTLNVVRRTDAVADLHKQGADHVLVSNDGLADEVARITDGAMARLAIDAVAGADTERLASCLATGGTLVNYGLLSGEPCTLHPRHPIFRHIKLEGFWLQRWWDVTPRAQINALFEKLAYMIAEGRLHIPVEATYPLTQAADAVRHAASPGRKGKVFITPNG